MVQEQFVTDFNERTGNNVQFIAAEYEPNVFLQMVRQKHLENESEGGKRCSSCFEMRLDIVAEKLWNLVLIILVVL